MADRAKPAVSFEVDVRVYARPFITTFGGAGDPFAERDAEFTIHLSVPDVGVETSAHAIRDGLIEAPSQAARLVDGQPQ